MVVKTKIRSGSVPPLHLAQPTPRSRLSLVPGSRISVVGRGGLLQPTVVRRASVAVPGATTSTVLRSSSVSPLYSAREPSIQPLSRSRLSTSFGSSTLPFVSRVQQPINLARRHSLAFPGGPSTKIWTVGSDNTVSLRKANFDISPSAPAAKPVYRPLGPSRPTLGLGLSQAPSPASRWGVRRASLAFGELYDNDYGFAPLPAPLPRRHYPSRTSSAAAVGGGGHHRTVSNDHPAEKSATRTLVISNDVKRKEKTDYENLLNQYSPNQDEFFSKLRSRAQVAKEQLSRNRVLLDRYLPLNLGPDNDVETEVETRYEELLSRMPQLIRQKTDKDADKSVRSVIPPYKPAQPVTSGQKLASEIAKLSVQKSFTPKISDTRKRARNVLCKVKGDPKYFDFS